MKKEKLAYAAPTTDLLELRVESRILDGSPNFFINGFSEEGEDELNAE